MSTVSVKLKLIHAASEKLLSSVRHTHISGHQTLNNHTMRTFQQHFDYISSPLLRGLTAPRNVALIISTRFRFRNEHRFRQEVRQVT